MDTIKNTTAFKRIRIDYYQYRVKKGRVDILLEKGIEADNYFVPFRYVMKNEKMDGRASWAWTVEDDGDLVILHSSINDCHLNRNNKEWIPLQEVVNLHFSQGAPLTRIQHCLALFLDSRPSFESALVEKIRKVFDDFLIDMAKADYINKLKRVLDGEPIVFFDATVTPPDKELIRAEIETLAHFKLYKMKRSDIDYLNMRYFYDTIDWEAFGSKIESIEMNIPLTELDEIEDNLCEKNK